MNARFDRQTWQRLVRLIIPVFKSEIKWKMFGLIGLLATFALCIAGANVVMSYLMSYLMTALSLREQEKFLGELGKYLLAIGCAIPLVVLYRYTEERFGLAWRRWFSIYFLKRYLSNKTYYSMLSVEGIDNPDQRLEEDIRSFTTQCVSFSLIVFNAIIALVAFIGILWSIDRWLPLAAVLYAGVGSLVTYLLGRPLISLNVKQLTKEANYRYKLISLRENAESIAFYRTERKELTRVRQKLRDALRNLLEIINWNRNLGFFVTGYNYLTIIVPTVIVAPRYVAGEIEFGVVTQAQGAFGQVLGALSLIVTHFGGISSFAAVISRLGAFSEAIDNTTSKVPGDLISTIEGERVELNKLTIFTPKRDQLLLHEVSIAIERGGLLIMGPSGCGKSSILRTVAGIWSSGEGMLVRPPLAKSFYLPQRSYATAGTLRAQLQYALDGKTRSTDDLIEAINFVGLTESIRRAGGLDAERDWPRLLSSGELQRLAWARLFLKAPEYVFLDEATTALDIATERRMYQALCQSTRLWVSVGLRQTLTEFHHTILELTGDGKWRLVCPT